jgi:hypothetical protein
MTRAEECVNILREAGRGLDWFVETGTADGYTTKSLKDDFKHLVTVELDHPRYLHVAVTEFLGSNIMPLWGDSAKVLKEVAYWLPAPALFWLDAHYSGGVRGDKDTPIEDELESIFPLKHHGSIVLIDDARLFGNDPAYPPLTWVEDFLDCRGDYMMKVEDDIIFIREWDD